MTNAAQTFGEQLRGWRQRRRLTQLDLACEADVSQRHISFLECGRSAPSREMVERLAERISLPLRERNALLMAAGFAPSYSERSLDDPSLREARRAVETILAAHAPFPALAVDRHWGLVLANIPARALLTGVDPALLQPPANVLRLSLHPAGLSTRIVNFREWRGHILGRLESQISASADPVLAALLKELKNYPTPPGAKPHSLVPDTRLAGIATPLQLALDGAVLSFLSTTTVFGTPVDITLSELMIESFFPANPESAELMRALAARAQMSA